MSPRVSGALVLVVAGCLLASCGSDSTEPSTVSPEEVVAATAGEVSAEISIAEEVIAAANSGNYEDWFSHFAADAIIPLNPLADVSVRDHFEFERALGTIRTSSEPCRMIANSVECQLTIENDLFAAAGIAPTVRSVLFFDNVGKIVTINDDWSDEIGQFWFEYVTWIKDAHPDVYDQIMEADSVPYVLMTPETAPLLMANIGEFLAESPVYPMP